MTSVKMTDLLIAFPQSVCLFDKLFNIVAEALDHKTHFKTWIFQYGSETIFFFSFLGGKRVILHFLLVILSSH